MKPNEYSSILSSIVVSFVLFPGGSDDWAKGKAGIKYSYTIELPDKGIYGFLLPADKIVPTGKELFTGVKSIVKSIVKINGAMTNKTNDISIE